MYLGSAWYPEHWPASRWPEDVRLMRQAGMNVCRIGEFAWSTMEPYEGVYKFDWLDEAIELLHREGLAVVLGTPTAAPPAWLTHHHPDTLLTHSDGKIAQHGARCHFNPGSHTYLKYVRRIAEQMARRYGPDARILGWQIDNEYGNTDYSETTRRDFQRWLKEQYKTLDVLNAHWSTAYWSQSYIDWNEIPLPQSGHNPGLLLAFKHFSTKVLYDYQKLQIDAIRQSALPEQWITHNFMGWFDAFDHYKISEDLDFASWDWYIGTGHHDYLRTGVIHDLTRGFKRKNFWVMETQPGSVNWAAVNSMLDKGEARCMAWHAIGHGADAILYWQWRSALGGQEQLHGSLIGADGKPRPFYSEAQQIGRDFEAVSETLDGTAPRNEVAILHSYDSRWSVNWQRHHKEYDPSKQIERVYAPFASRNVGVDVISAEATLGEYKLVIAPAIVILTEEAIEHLTDFVTNGGTLVLTTRTGQKDRHNALFPALQPGPLRDLAGAEVAEFYTLDQPVPVSAFWNDDENSAQSGESSLWAELLRPLSDATEILAKFGESNGWLDGGAAITRHPVGESGGQVIVVGAVLNAELQSDFTAWLLAQTEIKPVFANAPAGVEAARRVSRDGRAVTLFINHNREAVAFDLPNESPDLLTGETCDAGTTIPGYGVRLFETDAASGD